MNRSSRVLLLGWDAADWKVVRPLLAEGAMPNLAGLMARGVHGNHSTIYPALSPMLWTTISTGKRPPKHGVFGFSEPTPDGRGVRPCSILSRTTKAVWNILAQEGKRSLVVGWWPSFPAEPIPGAMVSNHFQQVPDDPDAVLPPLIPGTVSPERVAGEIADLRVRPWEIPAEVLRMFVPRLDEVDQAKDKTLHDLAKILAETLSVHAAATDLLERELYYNLARALTDAGKPHEAAPIFERLWDECPQEHRFGLHLLDALARAGSIPDRRAALDKLKLRAEEFASEAKAKLEALPDDDDATDPVAQRSPEARRKQFERRGYYERAAGLAVPLLREEINQCLLEGNKAEAERQLDGLIEGGELPYWLAQFAAEKLVALDRGDEALPLLEKLLSADPENPGLEALRAEIFYRKKDWYSLVDASTGALGLVYFNPRLHMFLGLALLQLGRTDDAKNELLVAVRQNPVQLPALEALEGLFRDDPAKAIAIRSMSETFKAKIAERRMRADEPQVLLATYEFAELCDAPPGQGNASEDPIIVTGLPRSGTSLLMRVLGAGGIPLLADAERPPDESNRLGYFEFASVKTTARDASWIGQAKGKAVKVVAPLLRYLPSIPATIIVLHRPLAQVLASQEAMKARLGAASQGVDPQTLSRQFAAMMDRLPGKLAERPEWRVLHVSFEATLADPAGQCARIAAFLGPRFDPALAASAVDPAQRRFGP